ncbi:hypothetical protein V6N13_053910 [Hibiscus sabdariffa]
MDEFAEEIVVDSDGEGIEDTRMLDHDLPFSKIQSLAIPIKGRTLAIDLVGDEGQFPTTVTSANYDETLLGVPTLGSKSMELDEQSKILHLDMNDYHGSGFTSFKLIQLWKKFRGSGKPPAHLGYSRA